MKKRFYKDTYQRGFNTRDDAENIPFESCQSLVNARPGGPAPSPREGIGPWDGENDTDDADYVLFSFPFKTYAVNYLIYIVGLNIYRRNAAAGATAASGEVSLGAFTESFTHVTGVRVKDSLYLMTDTGENIIVTLEGGVWSVRNANIPRNTMTLLAASHTGTGTAIPPGKFVTFAVTLVNRRDDGSFDGGGPLLCDLDTIGFNAGLLESVDDIDERVTYENTTGVIKDVDLSVEIGGALDPQVTHIRLYVTDPQTTAAAAEGAELKWFADLPATGSHANGASSDPGPVDPYTYTDEFDEGQIAGALDTLKVIGYDSIPPCRYGIYIQGRLWVGAADTVGDGIGRWYYSEIPLDLDAPQKWSSMFRLATYFKDTSIDNTDLGQGLGISRNDLVFVMSQSVWSLRDGDPDFEPQIIDADNGTPFPGTVTQIGRDCGYLGNYGPVLIQGREAVPLDEFAAGEVWPISRGRPGYFFALEDKSVVKGFFFRETFFIADPDKIVGMYMPNSGNGRGAWEVQPALPEIQIGTVAIFDRETCVIASSTALGPEFLQFLDGDLHQDLEENFFVKSKSMAFLFDARNRDQAGELYDVFVNASFSDDGRFDIFVTSTYFRYRWEATYDETPSYDDLTDASIDPSWRRVLQQGFPEGLVGFAFEVEWVKEYATPFDFDCAGFTLRAKPVKGHPVEYVSRDLGSGPLENGPDVDFWYDFDFNVLTEPDLGPAARSLAFADVDASATREYHADYPPSGGVHVIGSLFASGYRAPTWSGLPPLGVRGLTREYVIKSFGLLRNTWLELCGDGTSFFGVKISDAGALVLAVYTPTVKRTYTTAVETIDYDFDGDLEYTIQVTLSADMLTCRFYVALRTGAYTALPVPTMAVLPAGGPIVYEPGGINTTFKDLFASLDGAKWSGGGVSGGRLTSAARYIASTLTLGVSDVLTVSEHVSLIASGSFSGASLGFAGFRLILPDTSEIEFYVNPNGAAYPTPVVLWVKLPGESLYTIATGDTLAANETLDYEMTIEVSQEAIAFYLDGILKVSYKFSGSIAVLSSLYCTAAAHGNLSPGVEQVFMSGIAGLGTAGGTLDLALIPVRQVLLPGASLGMSFARGLKIAKPAIRAEAFHNAMKGKTK